MENFNKLRLSRELLHTYWLGEHDSGLHGSCDFYSGERRRASRFPMGADTNTESSPKFETASAEDRPKRILKSAKTVSELH